MESSLFLLSSFLHITCYPKRVSSVVKIFVSLQSNPAVTGCMGGEFRFSFLYLMCGMSCILFHVQLQVRSANVLLLYSATILSCIYFADVYFCFIETSNKYYFSLLHDWLLIWIFQSCNLLMWKKIDNPLALLLFSVLPNWLLVLGGKLLFSMDLKYYFPLNV